MISTRDLTGIPDIRALKRLCQSLATLDAIVEEDWELRYYSFDSQWDSDLEVASMRDGSGDQFFVLFAKEGAVIIGSAHESALMERTFQPPGIWVLLHLGMPSNLEPLAIEPAFEVEHATFCIWRETDDQEWHVADIDLGKDTSMDGSEELLSLFDNLPSSYASWSAEYYEKELPLNEISLIYSHVPLEAKLIARINKKRNLCALLPELAEIGYPHLLS